MKIKTFYNISPDYAIGQMQDFMNKSSIAVKTFTHSIKEDGTHYFTVYYEDAITTRKNEPTAKST